MGIESGLICTELEPRPLPCSPSRRSRRGPRPRRASRWPAWKLPQTSVTVAQTVAAGTLRGARPTAVASSAGASLAAAPAFCRVAATLTPSSDSDIKIEVWLPRGPGAWNGRFQAVGNGGWTGSIPYASMAAGDQPTAMPRPAPTPGHVGNTASFALGHPEKADRLRLPRRARDDRAGPRPSSTRSTASAPALSIWNGCSQGGRQGVAAAVRYPADFDAVIAGAPAVNYMHLHAGRMAMNRAVNATPAAVIPPAKYSAGPPRGDRRLRRQRRCGRRRDREPRRVHASIRERCSVSAQDDAPCLTPRAGRVGAADVRAARRIRPRAPKCCPGWRAGPSWDGR